MKPVQVVSESRKFNTGNNLFPTGYPPQKKQQQHPKAKTTTMTSPPSDLQGDQDYRKQWNVTVAEIAAIKEIQMAEIKGKDLSEEQKGIKALAEMNHGNLVNYLKKLEEKEKEYMKLLKPTEV